jgi:hypothetical protein
MEQVKAGITQSYIAWRRSVPFYPLIDISSLPFVTVPMKLWGSLYDGLCEELRKIFAKNPGCMC